MCTRTLGVSLLVHAAAVAAILIAPLLAAPPRLPVPDASFILVRPARVPVPEVAPPEAPSPEGAPASTETVGPVSSEPAPIVEPTSIAPPLFAPERLATSLPGVPRASDGAGGAPQAPPGPPVTVAEPRPVGGVIGRPEKVLDVPPAYPPIARAAGIAGIVIVEAVIDEIGVVRDARVLRSVPLLDEAALTAVRQWRFTPTTLNGVPIPVVMTVTVRFELW